MTSHYKKIAFTLAVSLAAHFCGAASFVTWHNDNAIVDKDNTTALPTTAQYLVMLIETASAGSSTIGFNPITQTPGAGETLVWSFVWGNPDTGVTGVYDNGFFSADLQNPAPAGAVGVGGILNGDTVYTVIIDSATSGTASNYTIIDGALPTAITVPDNGIADYALPGNNTWQAIAVPEPSSIALLAVGLGLAAFRMRKTSK